jgi:hypothetical protein
MRYYRSTVQLEIATIVWKCSASAASPVCIVGMAMAAAPNVIEVTAGEIAEELKRQGISSDERVTLTIEPEQEVIPGRRESRARVVAAGLTDDDIDRLIKQAQTEVEPHLG